MSELVNFDINQILKMLPHRYPFLLVDRVLELEAGQRVKALKNVTMNEPHFTGHFPEFPVMPGVLILEALAQTAALLTFGQDSVDDSVYFFVGIDNARFKRPVTPGDQLILNASIERFKGGIWKMIEGMRRLVSFRASDMQAAFLSVMSSFSGVYSRPPSLAGQNDDKIGRMMGWVAATTGISVEDQIAYYTHRFLAKSTKASVRNARSTLRKAARKELALQSTVNLSDLFSSDAWHYQPAVTCMELEAMREGHHMNVINHPLVEAAYATRGYAIHPSYGSRAPRPAAAISDTTRVITQTNEIC